MSGRAEDKSDIDQFRGLLSKWAGAIIVSGVVGFGTGGLALYSDVQSQAARAEEVHHRLERDIDALESGRDRDTRVIGDLARDVAGLKQAVESGQRDTRARLQRIEAAVDRLREGRRR